MHLMTVVLTESLSFVQNILHEQIKCLEKYKILIQEQIDETVNNIEIKYIIKSNNDDFEYIFQKHMASTIADVIMKHMEEKMVYNILTHEYYYFSLGERKSIVEHFKNIKEDETYECEQGISVYISTKGKLMEEIMDYFKESTIFNIEGFVRFRLKNYIEELKIKTDRAVEDFLMEKEYNEFIRLLRYFVEIQESKIHTVHVLMKDGKYHLYDSRNILIQNEYLEDLASDMAEKDISYDDLLISSLITLAPKKIILHVSNKIHKKEIIRTIQNVFGDRAYICNGCELCASPQVKQE
ncbi:putative sporulation protein YtxC [Inediibacterium massiliense]|uniref:putative sporulation protein YtxC n=1 Tax=Inediibacterium massiliense TaxID=1658111 RepID=UPI0006B4AE58|nr:putative sporulation protein YtxC [Inediibacterium massiliense]